MGAEWVRGSCIGKGSFGTVNLAHDESNGRIFAVKSVSLSSSPLPSIAALENEIEILQTLSSPYIVSYLGADTTESRRNLHMEYVPGGTVADAAGKLDELAVRAYARCVARALNYLHTVAGIVHCDVKGRNVLAGRCPGMAKLADFGSARRISDSGGGVGGTPLWMAPEVIRGENRTPIPESDIWSLGCTVIEMVTGRQPWGNSSCGYDQLVRIGFGDEVPEFPAGMSKVGRDFLDRCLKRNAAERWSAEQLLQHPFLAPELGENEPSPRSVLDCGTLEFDRDSSDDEGEGDSDEVMDLGRERIRDLALGGGSVVDWEGSEGWEVVRDLGEIGDSGSEELGDWDEASGNGMTCHSISNCCCCCCDCCCCKRGLRFFGWCELLVYLMVVNEIQFFFLCFRLGFDQLTLMNLVH